MLTFGHLASLRHPGVSQRNSTEHGSLLQPVAYPTTLLAPDNPQQKMTPLQKQLNQDQCLSSSYNRHPHSTSRVTPCGGDSMSQLNTCYFWGFLGFFFGFVTGLQTYDLLDCCPEKHQNQTAFAMVLSILPARGNLQLVASTSLRSMIGTLDLHV